MTAPGSRADPVSLNAAAGGISAVVEELRSLTTVGRASAGRGVSELELDAAQLGHDGLAGSFSTFCSRWEWAVRGLVQDGADMAEGLHESARVYTGSDENIGSSFSRLLSVAVGDPQAAPEHAAQRSPGEIVESTIAPQDADAWSRAGDSMARTWSGVGSDIVDTGTDRIRRALDGENPYAPEIDGLHEIVE